MTGFVGDHSFPRLPLIGAGVLVVFALVAIAATRLTGVGGSHDAPSQAQVARDLRFEDLPNGAVAVFDAGTNAEIAQLAQGQDGFVRGVLRAFARERRAKEAAVTTPTAGAPFRLSLTADGQLSIQDMATGRALALNAFGQTNAGAFAALLQTRAAQAAPSKEIAR